MNVMGLGSGSVPWGLRPQPDSYITARQLPLHTDSPDLTIQSVISNELRIQYIYSVYSELVGYISVLVFLRFKSEGSFRSLDISLSMIKSKCFLNNIQSQNRIARVHF